MDMATALTPDQQLVLQAAYDAFKPTGSWPIHQHLDTLLDQEQGIDLDSVLGTMPPGLLRTYEPMRPDREIALRVAGIAHCGGSEDDLALFTWMLRWGVDRERSFRPASPTQVEQLIVTSEEAASEWRDAGEEVTVSMLSRAIALIEAEQLYAGLGSEDGKWTWTVPRTIRRFRGVRSYADYVRIIATSEQPKPKPPMEPFATPMYTRSKPEVGGQGAVRELSLRVQNLHPAVREAVEGLFASLHYRQGVLDAALVLRDMVRTKSGLSETDDSSLMGKALAGREPRIIVADLSTESGRNIQRGTAYLAQGIVARLRNPLTHEKVELDAHEAMEMVALISRVVRDVDAGRVADSDRGDSP